MSQFLKTPGHENFSVVLGSRVKSQAVYFKKIFLETENKLEELILGLSPHPLPAQKGVGILY